MDESLDLDSLLEACEDAVDEKAPATIKFIPHPPLQDKSPNMPVNPKIKMATLHRSPQDSSSPRNTFFPPSTGSGQNSADVRAR